MEPGSDLLSHGESPALPSALSGFTSEFGMGSGGSRSLWPPGKLVAAASSDATANTESVQAGMLPTMTAVSDRLGVIWSSLTGN